MPVKIVFDMQNTGWILVLFSRYIKLQLNWHIYTLGIITIFGRWCLVWYIFTYLSAWASLLCYIICHSEFGQIEIIKNVNRAEWQKFTIIYSGTKIWFFFILFFCCENIASFEACRGTSVVQSCLCFSCDFYLAISNSILNQQMKSIPAAYFGFFIPKCWHNICTSCLEHSVNI